ncbi:MAG: hypothetical protein Q8P83_00010 [bacterium]|nr:hypothetical protein [bacterium]
MNKLIQKISIILLLLAFVFPSFDSFRLGNLFAPKTQTKAKSDISASANASNQNPGEVQTGEASAEVSVITVVNLDVEDEQTIVVKAEPGESKSESSIQEEQTVPVSNPIIGRIFRMLRR